VCKIGVSHKRFVNKQRFHPMCSRDQNRHFLGNWRKISVIKMEVAAIRAATVVLFFLHHKWLASQCMQMKCNKRCYLAFGCLVFRNTIMWDSSGRSLYHISLMTDFGLGNSGRPNQHLRCCAMKLVRSLVQLSNHNLWGKVMCGFFVNRGIYSVNVFPS